MLDRFQLVGSSDRFGIEIGNWELEVGGGL
jgi:hypothetical protein